MAQRTIHYLFGEMIARHVELRDKERFLLGSIMPDAIDTAVRDKSHFKARTDTHVFFDFDAFRERYAELVLSDDLYLGYYMHLVEDAFYREFVYQDRFTMPRNPEEVKLLHNDYHILNSYIVEKYGVRNILHDYISLENEPICDIADFKLREFLSEMSNDFTEQTKGDTVFLTESMLDEFIGTYMQTAIDAVKSLKNGTPALRAADFAYLRRQPTSR